MCSGKTPVLQATSKHVNNTQQTNLKFNIRLFPNKLRDVDAAYQHTKPYSVSTFVA